ncbi:beta-ketoacyl synthase chain length factor [Stutzerimonas azotifigens]|uniref:beta-ketoacyl synthase chain length factor n=1 Tax=Stutzerimonas azotifigens TaxID=291995 RepID=UPI00040EB5DA|nr:beta-ketoacyl synthase chain length factor [Stutzerimonas azotifigens]
MVEFNIERWQAWAPGLECPASWSRWAAAPWPLEPADAQPAVDFLPAMQRRRLSRLARMAFAVAAPLADGRPPMPLVYVSRHGETPRNYALLAELAREEPLSPTQFSLSVHNAFIGLWSILRGDPSEMTALAGEGDGLEHAVLEAAMLLAEGAPAVLLVVAEDQPPAIYGPWIDDVPCPYAVALLLTPGQDWRLALEPPSADAEPSARPHALELVRALALEHPQIRHSWKSRQWNWQRTH